MIWIFFFSVHAVHTAPIECSCRPTSNESLSVRDLEVFRQVRYWGKKKRMCLRNYYNMPRNAIRD